ncbi:hypothetical protein EDB80DRAFT_750804 [Ilyonectria destructans]|nr:hypothetical protein EDB80DRAFT_750804 [Ilyonectria destructans]
MTPPEEVNGQREQTLRDVQEKYQQERVRRLRDDGMAQFTDLFELDKFKKFLADPWTQDTPTNGTAPPTPPADQHCEILIVGAGHSGLLFAARLIDAGFSPDDILMVDNAGGFGGTWYWNRYPGLMCDVESYIYMPLIEETGYMPKMKYSSGEELRLNAERIATKWKLQDRAMFHCRASRLAWDDARKEWVSTIFQQNKGRDVGPAMTVKSRFVMLTSGISVIPQIPVIKGLETFKNDIFHTARWDYNITGGTQTDPSMVKLKGKRVGIIGTGATAIQVVPELVKWADQLYVFQRTPSAVDRRDNRATDEGWWNRETVKPGWQHARQQNFNEFMTHADPKPDVNLVSDGWTSMPSYSAIIGNKKTRPPEKLEDYRQMLHALDLIRQGQIRQRTEDIIQDKDTAEMLKAWYPGWCKRPCFHDEYLQAFNNDNITLVDTNARGVELVTETGVVVGGQEYPLDVLVLSTGYRSAFLYSPPRRVDIDVFGRDNRSLDKKWSAGVTTLFGMMSHDFPNMFWPGFVHAGGTPNFTFSIDLAAKKVAAMMAQSHLRLGSNETSPSPYRYNFTVEATSDAEEEWSNKIAAGAGMFLAAAGCTPSYINAEGELDREVSVEVQKRRARGSMWSKGVVDFEQVVEEWQKGGFEGVVMEGTE